MKVKVKVAQSCLTLCDPMDYTVCGILQNTGVGSLSLLQGMDLPNPGIKPRSPTLQADSLPAEPQGKPFAPYSSETVIFTVSKFTCTSVLCEISPSLPAMPDYAQTGENKKRLCMSFMSAER